MSIYLSLILSFMLAVSFSSRKDLPDGGGMRQIEYDYLEEPEEELSYAICIDALVALVYIQPCGRILA
jgi:hypothetical protein